MPKMRTIGFKINESDWQVIAATAQASGYSPGEFARELVLNMTGLSNGNPKHVNEVNLLDIFEEIVALRGIILNSLDRLSSGRLNSEELMRISVNEDQNKSAKTIKMLRAKKGKV